jgi:putative protease
MNQPELLAPAGTFACAEAAFDHGADAVYIGIGKLSLRAHSPNFAIEDLSELLALTRAFNKKIYATLNVMPNQYMIKDVRQVLEDIRKREVFPDAFIVSDPGVIMLCKEIIPDVELHLSTQTGTFNLLSLEFWKKQGIVRAVLPREFTVDQIAEASSSGIMETEIFIHGAMCVSVSGRCLLGAYAGSRHPNFGDCPQPCRLKYTISAAQTENSREISFDAEEDGEGVYLLNSKDLCTISILPDIINSGVHSLKIEGRNKSAHYVASVVKTYRSAINSYFENPENYIVKPEWLRELDVVEHRTYTTGFYKKENTLQDVFTSKATGKSRVVGMVKAILPGGLPVIDVKNSFSSDEKIEILPVQQSLSPFEVHFDLLTDLSNNPIFRPPSNRLVIGHTATKLRPGDMLRKVSD